MAQKATEATQQDPQAEYELHVMRHGLAVTSMEAGDADNSKRPLTQRGRKRMEEIGKGLRRLGLALDWIVSSPVRCAAETAEIVAWSLGSNIPVEISDTLSPGRSADEFIAFLAEHPNCKRTLAVGHEPGLSELASRCIGANPQANLKFRKGGCCLITFDEFPPKAPGELVWWLPPRVLRTLA